MRDMELLDPGSLTTTSLDAAPISQPRFAHRSPAPLRPSYPPPAQYMRPPHGMGQQAPEISGPQPLRFSLPTSQPLLVSSNSASEYHPQHIPKQRTPEQQPRQTLGNCLLVMDEHQQSEETAVSSTNGQVSSSYLC